MQLAYAKSSVINTGSLGTTQATVDINPTIMHVLSRDLYQRPIEAVFRETITNALDSHVEQGTEDIPIEIKMPSIFSEDFYIRDYGTGLSLEDIKELYLSYGKSTRRCSNDYTGAFGLGCKASLAYTSGFSVSSYFNGYKHEFLVYYDQDNIPCLDHRSTEETSELNGLKIAFTMLNPQDFSQFQAAAIKVLSRIPSDKFVILGTDWGQDKSIFQMPDGYQYGNVVFRDKSSYQGSLRIVMGYVAYDVDVESLISSYHVDDNVKSSVLTFTVKENIFVPAKIHAMLSSLLRHYDLEIIADLGTYSIHPSREFIILTRRTIDNIIKDISHSIQFRLDCTQDQPPLLSDLFLYRTINSVPEYAQHNIMAKIICPHKYASSNVMHTTYFYKYDMQFISELDRISEPNYFTIYCCPLPKEVLQRVMAHNLSYNSKLVPYLQNKVVIFYAENVNPELSNQIFKGLPKIDIDLSQLNGVDESTATVVNTVRATSAANPKDHNVLMLVSGNGYIKFNWRAEKHNVETLRALNKEIFWVPTKLGCVRDDNKHILNMFYTIKSIIPKHLTPVIIGLPATKGTLSIERAFKPITELESYLTTIFTSSSFMRRYSIMATIMHLESKFGSPRIESLKRLRFWYPADLVRRFYVLQSKYKMGNLHLLDRFMTVDRDKYVNQNVVEAYGDIMLKLPSISRSRFSSWGEEHVAWANSISILLKQPATSAKFKNRG